MGFSGNPTLNP